MLLHKKKSSNIWKPVALKERLYYIITEEHLAIGHGAAKATYKQVSHKYHGVNRCLVDKFVKKYKKCKTHRISIKPLDIKPIIGKFFIQRLQDKLGKWLEDCQNENEDLCWTVGLATIIHSMSLSVCCATNKRPFELVFGYEPRGNCVLIDQLWSQGVRYKENIPDDVQIEDYDDIQFNDNKKKRPGRKQ
ncbi:retrotransposon nucleocapsid protein [Gigaspora margarita]|uniref:Retrotransposon nucleocapsid protein n=1 Tax=Gigaspora margarita TaxID=4874 RepID=A0A8H4AE61_GIGMA|nr:retrotransposon nucleocapsid protein [Gigaspora margarita]